MEELPVRFGVLNCELLQNVRDCTIKKTEWNFILLFSFLSKTELDTNEVNLFEQFRYRELLTYFSEVLLGRMDLDPIFKLRNKPQPLYSVIA